MPNEVRSPASQPFDPHPRLIITSMQLDDLPAIMDLEAICFASPWSADIYHRELEQNPFSFYHVIRPGVSAAELKLPPILAYGGCLVMGDECHLMTIATHPERRRQRLSEWLLLHLLAEARTRAATCCTLEVRAGNRAAIALYEKLGFERVGLRRGYYPVTKRSAREDALIMTAFGLDSEACWRSMQSRLTAVQASVEVRLLIG